MYTMSDGKTVIEWWEQGSSTNVRQGKPFEERLLKFNQKIEFKRKNRKNPELFLSSFFEIAHTRFWKQATQEASNYYYLSRSKARALSKYLSIPDSILMRRLFPEQRYITDYI